LARNCRRPSSVWSSRLHKLSRLLKSSGRFVARRDACDAIAKSFEICPKVR
jgi:hypothetical protein